MAGRYSIEATFKLIDEITRPLENIAGAGSAVGDKLKLDFLNAEENLNSFGKNIGGSITGALDSIGSTIGNMAKWAVAGSIGAISVGLGVATAQYINFDDALHKAGAVFSDLDPKAADFNDRLKELGTAARDVAAVTEFNAQQSADALATMAMAGMKTNQALALLPKTADLATAAGLKLDVAVGMAADTLGVFNLMSEDTDVLADNFQRVSDIMVRTASLANQDISQVFAAMSGGGAFFNKGNQAVEDMGAMIDALASRNLKGSEAGTAIRNIMLRVSAPSSDPAKSAMERLGLAHWEDTGVKNKKGNAVFEFASDILDQEGNLINIIDIIDKLNAGIQGMGGAEVDELLHTIFGEGAIIAIKNLMDVGGDALRGYRTELEASVGATAQSAAVMRDSIRNQIEVLKSGLTELGFKFVESFQDKGVDILNKLIGVVNNFDPTPIINFAVFASDKLAVLGSVLWDLILALKPGLDELGSKFVEVFQDRGVSVIEDITEAVRNFNPTPMIDAFIFILDKVVALAGVVWDLRVAIAAVIGVMITYKTVMSAVVVVTKAMELAQKLSTAASYAYNIVILKNTHALGFLKAETLGTRLATAAFSVALKIGQGAMAAWNFTKYIAGLVAAKASTLAMAAAQGIAAGATAALSTATGILNALFVASPVGWIVLGIAALIAIIILCIKHWDKIKVVLSIVWDWIKKVASIIRNTLVAAFTTAIEWITNFITIIWEGLVAAFTAVVEWITNTATAIWTVLVAAFTTAIEWITNFITIIWEGLVAAFTAVVDRITNTATAIWITLVAAITIGIEWVTNFAAIIWDTIVAAFTAVVDWITNTATAIWTTLVTAFTVAIQWITNLTTAIWEGLILAFSAAKTWIFSIIDSLKSFGGTILSAVLAPIQGMLEVLAKIPGVGELLNPAIQKISDFRSGLTGIPSDVSVNQSLVPKSLTGMASATTALFPPQLTSTANSANQTIIPNSPSQAIAAAAVSPTQPMTSSEQMIYSQTENRESLDINLNAVPGTQAQVGKQPKSPNVNLVVSGSNR